MAGQQYEILDPGGVRSLAQGILTIVNQRITERIVNVVNANSDDSHVASAAAVYRAITSSRHLKMTVVEGDINTLVPLNQRKTDVIYLQRDDENDTTWMMYIWNADPDLNPDPDAYWINLGTTEIDLSNYWSKSSGDMVELREALGLDDLEADVLGLEAELDYKLDRNAINRISASDIQSILSEADLKTDAFPGTYTLTINYVDTNGDPITDPHVESKTSGTDYSVESPEVEGYYTQPTTRVVSGVMPKNDLSIDVTYDEIEEF